MMTEGLRSWRRLPGFQDTQGPQRPTLMHCGEDVIVLTEWGSGGVKALRDQAAVLVIVDVLSFSTAVAVSKGAVVYPFPYSDEEAAQTAADRVGAVLAEPRRSSGSRFSLSPQCLMAVPAGTRIMLPSPSGARRSLACGDKPVLTGCLRNAAAVARMARQIANGGPVGVVPAGERWPDGSLRPASKTCWALAQPSTILL